MHNTIKETYVTPRMTEIAVPPRRALCVSPGAGEIEPLGSGNSYGDSDFN